MATARSASAADVGAAAGSAPDAKASPEPERPGAAVVYLKDGRILEGVVVERDSEGFLFETGPGERARFPNDTVRHVAFVGAPIPEAPPHPSTVDPLRTQALQAPSGFMPEPRGLTLILEMGRPIFQYGISRHFAVRGGIPAPLQWDEAAPTGSVQLIAGAEFLEILRLAASVEVRYDSAGWTGYLTATAAVGTPAASLALHAGPLPPGAAMEGTFRDMGIAVAGHVRLPGTPVGAVAEVWAAPWLSGDWLGGVALRWSGQSFAVDGGVRRIGSGTVAPWLGLAFGLAGPSPFKD